jgi:hypothetical protein
VSNILESMGTFLSKILVRAHRLREKIVHETSSDDRSALTVFLRFFNERSKVKTYNNVQIATAARIILRNSLEIVLLIYLYE